MNFKKWVKSIQTAAYNGARTVYYKTKMGVEGVIFESHPPNFENLYNF
jgi:hypothetical protein